MNNINFVPSSYHVLRDISTQKDGSKKETTWVDRKVKSKFIAESYKRIGNYKKSALIDNCASVLEFKQYSDNTMKLHSANFCKCRLCTMCAWRRSLKIYGQLNQVINKVQEKDKYTFLFLTLTIKNVTGNELDLGISTLLDGYDRLFKLSKVKSVIKGSYRVLEITHNTKERSKDFNTFHPHLHCILAVEKDAITQRAKQYIKQAEWVEMWKSCIRADYNPICDIRLVKPKDIDGMNDKSLADAIKEVSKYTVKEQDIFNSDKDLMDLTIKYLDFALANRRLISFRGVFADAKKELNLDDAIDGDLVVTDSDQVNKELEFVIVRYKWFGNFFNYIELNEDYEPKIYD